MHEFPCFALKTYQNKEKPASTGFFYMQKSTVYRHTK